MKGRFSADQPPGSAPSARSDQAPKAKRTTTTAATWIEDRILHRSAKERDALTCSRPESGRLVTLRKRP
ncbi:hypothetical protein Cob_v008271 [Colletotrichum orbiculare MAFF 240422]|uniref:Uncharacterized protein n=1 Tax=Colletotrichum orbiculare (strain 104-T / ATCC 96160 / CBS 514.97 / LARS 414 / MAFF 240422) TaxID=1213857 RepID=A0A484FLK2_COLOR|nr:hypothetical protein Cob_v008271 [Colletotrichum orbiculare MAFF 240422]